MVARWTVRPQHLQPFGIVHDGVYCAVHESTASIGSQMWLHERGIADRANNSTDSLRPAGEGEVVTTTAVPIHQGRKQQLWRMESTNAADKALSIGQVRIQNLDTTPPPKTMERMNDYVAGM